MAETYNVLQRANTIDVSPELNGYSKVVIYVGKDDEGNDIVYTAGNDTGKTLEIKNEWGTQAMANNILTQVRGWRYRPYKATKALIDPTSEMGDAVNVTGAYGGLYKKSTIFGKLMQADISAPSEEEIEHEFAYEVFNERTYSRFVKQTKSQFTITASNISAEVSARQSADSDLDNKKFAKEGGRTDETFGWNLQSNSWTVYSGSGSNKKNILVANNNGLTVNGIIEANEGHIGGSNGFVIAASKIYKTIQSFSDDSKSTGVYIGTDGIRLGKNFTANSSGTVTAKNLALTGGSIKLGLQSDNSYNFQVTNSGAVTIKNGSISLGADADGTYKFKVTNAGAVMASNLTLTGGSIKLGQYIESGQTKYKFQVTSGGAVTASNLTIKGGSININNKFRVDSNGNLTAENGTFKGNIYAKNIQYGGDYGTFSGAGITGGSIGIGSGTALSAGAVSGINWGGNFGAMTNRQYTADWVVGNHFLCSNGGHFNGTLYGAVTFADEESHWLKAGGKIPNGVSVSVGATGMVYVRANDGLYHWVITDVDGSGVLDYSNSNYVTY